MNTTTLRELNIVPIISGDAHPEYTIAASIDPHDTETIGSVVHEALDFAASLAGADHKVELRVRLR